MSSSSPMHLSLRRLGGLVLVGVVLLLAGAFATGRVGYVATNGISMEPTYHAGDLVVLLRSGTYHHGQIVAYHGGPGGKVEVLHRIVGGDATGFAIKGDNNQSTDPTHPRADQIIGRAVLHVPQLGGIVGSPVTKGLALLALLALIGFLVKKPAPLPGAAYGSRRASDRSTTGWKSFLVTDLVLLVLVGLTFGFVSPAPPPAVTPHNQTGTLSYSASPPVSDVYPTGVVATGDPVFVKLLSAVGVAFHYSTDAPAEQASGTVRLDAAVSTSSGWHTTLPLTAETPLVNGAADVTGTLDLTRIQTLATDVAKATGVGAGSITVDVTGAATVTVGSAKPVDASFVLPLQLSAMVLSLGSSAKTEPTQQGPAVTSTTALTPAAPAPAKQSKSPASKIRLVLLILLLLSAAATAVVWPAGSGDDNKVVVVRTPTLDIQIAESTTLIQVPDRRALIGVALNLGATLVQGDDGWEGVFAPNAVYWAITPPASQPESTPPVGGDPATAGPPGADPPTGDPPARRWSDSGRPEGLSAAPAPAAASGPSGTAPPGPQD